MTRKIDNELLKKNPWSPEDEGDHYPSMREWWCYETLFKTLNDQKKWSIKLSIAYEMETPSCFYMLNLIDVDRNKCVLHKEINDEINKFKHKKNRVDLKYKNTTVKGLFPDYTINIKEEKDDFSAKINLNGKIPPYWSAKNVTNGYLPIGASYYRYGWLINCDLYGSINLNNNLQKIKGKGYIERAWGDFLYSNPFKSLSKFRKTISIYSKLGLWWISKKNPKIPDRLSFMTENNPFGYDWFWGVFDNNWSIFYGNLLFWFSEGPGFGMLTLCNEKGEYIEFSDMNFRYDKTNYIKEYDLVYPTDMTITAEEDDKKINLKVYPICDPHTYIDDFKDDSFYRAFIMPEMVGEMKGEYKDENGAIDLKGTCKIERQRQPSVLGHNKLTLDLLKPPKGLGLFLNIDSHYLNKKMAAQFQMRPKIKFNFSIKEPKK